ncbi:hypothetical protein PUN28_002162 [Cardiocondyla obscurior]|uniref:SAP domain-containing protein n=1 Tax=Cardiocondyla obscurior TaxID=286306 RepID=A0AAW2GSV1_9HYME
MHHDVQLLNILAELKEKLKGLNLPSSGAKLELVKRLLNAGVPSEELQAQNPPTETADEHGDEAWHNAGEASPAPPSILLKYKFLRQKRDLAVREAELLRRECELLRMSPRCEESARTGANGRKWKDLKDLISEFDGNCSDSERWEKQVRKLLASYALDDYEAKAILCNHLAG